MQVQRRRIPKLTYLSDNDLPRAQPRPSAPRQPEPLNQKHKPANKAASSSTRGLLTTLIGAREPSEIALRQYASQQAQNGSLSSTSSRKLPANVPKVTSKWDGMPANASKSSSRASRSLSSRQGPKTSHESQKSSAWTSPPSNSQRHSPSIRTQSSRKCSRQSSSSSTNTSDCPQPRRGADYILHSRSSSTTSSAVRAGASSRATSSRRASRIEPLGDGATLPGLEATVGATSIRSSMDSADTSWYDSDASSDSEEGFNLSPDCLFPESPRLRPANLDEAAIVGDSIGLVSAWPTPKRSPPSGKQVSPRGQSISASQGITTRAQDVNACTHIGDERSRLPLLVAKSRIASSNATTASALSLHPISTAPRSSSLDAPQAIGHDMFYSDGVNRPSPGQQVPDRLVDVEDSHEVMPSPIISRDPRPRPLHLEPVQSVYAVPTQPVYPVQAASGPAKLRETKNEDMLEAPRPVSRPTAPAATSYSMPKQSLQQAPPSSPVRNFTRPFSANNPFPESPTRSKPPRRLSQSKSYGQASGRCAPRGVAITSPTLATILESETSSVKSLQL